MWVGVCFEGTGRIQECRHTPRSGRKPDDGDSQGQSGEKRHRPTGPLARSVVGKRSSSPATLLNAFRPERPGQPYPFHIEVDSLLPENTIEFRYGQRIVGRIINIKKGDRMAENKDVAQEIVKEYLKCLLTEKEKTELSAKIAKAISDRSHTEARLKEVSASLKADIAKLDAEISETALQINNGYEYRNVECRMDKDYRLGTITVTRLDTGEVIRERPMTGEERQMKLPVRNKEGEKEKEKEKEKPAKTASHKGVRATA
jgi:uncharacterized FlaG/YvyC family protein